MTLLAFVFTSVGLTIWFWITLGIGLVWLRRHIDLNHGVREPELREEDAAAAPPDLPPVSLLIAAKDEALNIGRCIDSLLRQDYPNLQVILINDRSADSTPSLIDAAAARDTRVTAVHVRELPEGWFGKNNAMREGLEHATADWLCFSDADCTYESPRLLRAALAYALREKVEFLSVLPRLETNTIWERIVQPVAGAVMVFWFPPKRVNNPASATAYANGAFMLMTRDVYERMGGHAFAKATLNEDMHMARRAKALGLRLRVVPGGGLYRVRMYVGLKQIWRGWSRIFYGCFGTLPRLIVSVLMLAVFSVSPYLTLLLSPLADEGAWWLAGAGLFAVLAQQSIMWRFYAISRTAPGLALTYPIGAAFCLAMTLNAMTRVLGRSTDWRGTRYVGGAKAS